MSDLGAVPREARPYQGRRAGVVSRFLASAIDFVVLAVVLGMLYGGYAVLVFLWRPSQFTFPDVPSVVLLVAGAVVLGLYLTAAWATTGRTYGNHVLGLRVVDARGQKLSVVLSLLRAGFCVAFPIGLLWCAVNASNRSVQDVVLRTSVIYDWRERAP